MHHPGPKGAPTPDPAAAARRRASTGRPRARLLATALLLVAGGPAAAGEVATETFDLTTFEVPAGARAVRGEVVTFTQVSGATYQVLGVYRSARGGGDPAADFRDEWAQLVAGAYQLTGPLRSAAAARPGGWTVTVGSAPARGEGTGPFTALLAVFSGHGVKVSVLATYNDDRYRPGLDRFMERLALHSPPAAGPQATGAGGLAPGFSVTVPPGFAERDGWYVTTRTENRGGGPEITSALVRPLPGVPPGTDMGAALRSLWGRHLPAEVRDRAGAMVYRRYVGDGVPAQFVAGRGREAGHQADTLFTLYLLDCGAAWQPVLVAQTYEEPGAIAAAGVAFTAGVSYGTSAALAEPFLAGLRCPAGRGRPLVDPPALVGDWSFGSGASLQWVNVYTGATSMTAVTFGGNLDLGADGRYRYRYQGASGLVGAMSISTDAATGRWSVDRDLLVLTRDGGGGVTRYRIAGLARFERGERGAVFMSRLDQAVNPTTVTDGGDYYAAHR